jgi:hypothetical protein
MAIIQALNSKMVCDMKADLVVVGCCFLGAHISNASFSIMDTWTSDLEDGWK